MQSHPKVLARDANTPKRDVKKSVALNAVVRPMRSEPGNEVGNLRSMIGSGDSHVPHPTAPNIIPANIEEDSVPM